MLAVQLRTPAAPLIKLLAEIIKRPYRTGGGEMAAPPLPPSAPTPLSRTGAHASRLTLAAALSLSSQTKGVQVPVV